MIALIYAAGSSLRIKKSINIEHKSLLKVKKKRLIEHQLTWIQKAGVKKIIIIVNKNHEKLISLLKNFNSKIPIKLIYNNDTKSQNMKSFYLAKKDIAKKDVIFTTSDLYCDLKNIKKFLNSKKSNKILVDINKKNYTGDEVLVQFSEKNLIKRCSKKIEHFDGMAIGVYKFSAYFINKMLEYAENNNEKGYFDKSLYYAIDNSIYNTDSIFPIKTVNNLWYDIDTFKEYILLKKQYDEK